MSINPAILRALQAAGATVDMIIAAVEADAAEEKARLTEKRAKDADRQRRSRASRAVTVTPRDDADSPPNDIYSNPPRTPSAKADEHPLAERVVLAWNEMAATAGVPKSRKLNPRFRAGLNARVKEHGEVAVFEAIANVALSPWHCGENEDRWQARLGWLLTSPVKFQNMLELQPKTANGRPHQPWTAERAAEAEARRRRMDERLGRTEPIPIGRAIAH